MSELRAWEIPTIESGTELSDIEVIRVLEARPRVREEAEEAVASRPVVRELAQPTRPAPSAAARPASAINPNPAMNPNPAVKSASVINPGPAGKPVAAVKPVPAVKPREERDSLAETLNELRKFAFDLESDDTGSTTGVRHLQVELDTPANRKSRGPRR